MAIKITDIAKDLPVLNQELKKFDVFDSFIQQQQEQNQQLRLQIQQLGGLKDGTSCNSLNANWDGPTSTLSWPAGFFRDTSHAYAPFPAGKQVGLAPSTDYWLAWNPSQQVMSIHPDINRLMTIQQLLVMCRLFTGTAGQTGPAGCGGTEPVGTGINGKEYHLF